MKPCRRTLLLIAGLSAGLVVTTANRLYASDPATRLTPATAPAPATRSRPTAVIDLVTTPLPVVTPELTPGVAAPRPGPLPLSRPLFLVGADALSLRWLAARREHLQQLGAVGLLVQALAPTDLAAVRAVAGGLPILPMPGSDLARYLGLAHYPVLITPDGMAP